eukprot:GHVT01074959.1.p1 GENE.GHVT01074959.1~~GHVT01074959.1.p1  ORF type:complete len:546 (+),score=107.60 GHVT01074959.1:2551-4188(+)
MQSGPNEAEAAHHQNLGAANCEVCGKVPFRYTCPKCEMVYCSLECYRRHSSSCVSRFQSEAFRKDYEGVKPTASERVAFEKQLGKMFHNMRLQDDAAAEASEEEECAGPSVARTCEDEADSDPASDQDDEEEIDEERLEKLTHLAETDALCETDLTAYELRLFRSALKRQALQKHFAPYEPWWQKIELPPTPARTPQHLCCPPSGRTTSPLVAHHILQLVYAYVHTWRRYAGDVFGDLQSAAAIDAEALTAGVWTATRPPSSVAEALDVSLQVARSVRQSILVPELRCTYTYVPPSPSVSASVPSSGAIFFALCVSAAAEARACARTVGLVNAPPPAPLAMKLWRMLRRGSLQLPLCLRSLPSYLRLRPTRTPLFPRRLTSSVAWSAGVYRLGWPRCPAASFPPRRSRRPTPAGLSTSPVCWTSFKFSTPATPRTRPCRSFLVCFHRLFLLLKPWKKTRGRLPPPPAATSKFQVARFYAKRNSNSSCPSPGTTSKPFTVWPARYWRRTTSAPPRCRRAMPRPHPGPSTAASPLFRAQPLQGRTRK